MQTQTIQKFLHTGPRKLRLVSDIIRKMEPLKALDVLEIIPKAAAKDLGKALKVVLANAKQQGLDISKLTFKKIEINESMKMRRFRAGTRGRAKPYKKRMSHIKIVLSDELESKNYLTPVAKTQEKEKKQVKKQEDLGKRKEKNLKA
ncbi:50S ribosomal protein L22 [Patescibacteria group bacterium]|nr:50S ribosomal protein L22 [Patescibacteria group bacterium]